MRTVFVRVVIRILPAMMSMIVAYGHASKSFAYLLTGASVRDSSANAASEQHTSLGKVNFTNSPGQIVMVVSGARNTRARLTA